MVKVVEFERARKEKKLSELLSLFYFL